MSPSSNVETAIVVIVVLCVRMKNGNLIENERVWLFHTRTQVNILNICTFHAAPPERSAWAARIASFTSARRRLRCSPYSVYCAWIAGLTVHIVGYPLSYFAFS